MTTVAQPVTFTEGPNVLDGDPYRLGWRYVVRRLADGSEVHEQVPLTPEGVLHPEEDDFVVQTDAHENNRVYLRNVFKHRLREREGALVLCDHRIAWDVPDLRPLGPDLMVLFNVRPGPRLATFDVAREGTRPSLILEVTSPSTRHNDLGIKIDYYYRAGIPWYVIVDIVEDEAGAHFTLIGYRHSEAGYVHMTPNEREWLWLEPLQLWLGVQGGSAVCFEPDGTAILDYTEVATERDALATERDALTTERNALATERDVLAAQVAAESQARSAAERKLQEMEEEIRRLRGQG